MATNLNQQLETPPVPDLPNPQDRYERLTVAQTNERLRTFFLRVRNAFQALLGPRGGKYLNSPYGAFQDSTNQTDGSTSVAYYMRLNTTDYSNGVSVSSRAAVVTGSSAPKSPTNPRVTISFTSVNESESSSYGCAICPAAPPS